MAEPRELSLRSLGGGRWEVTSRRGEVVSIYYVDPNRLACSCPSGRRARKCAHLAAVLDHLTGRDQIPETPEGGAQGPAGSLSPIAHRA
jgi:hypothetical protein